MSHQHHHDHVIQRSFAIGVALNVIFVVVEAGFGLWSESLALLADAGHNATDVLGLLLAWGALLLGKRLPSLRRTYGWRSSTIMAALLNSLLLLVVIGGIAWEAVGRLQAPAQVSSAIMILVAAVGVLINTLTALLFMSGRKHDLNIRGAFLHMAADAGVSLGVVTAGVLIWLTNWLWIDPVVSLLIAAVILISTWSLFMESLNLFLHAVPAGIDPKSIEAYLDNIPGITTVHDLHIWAMSTTETALTVHLVKPDHTCDDELITEIARYLKEHFGIGHATIQWERDDCRANGGCACEGPACRT